MYICICENVTERQLRAEVRNGVCSLSQARRSCGVARRCGVCAQEAKLVILEEQLRAAPVTTATAG
ncbi:(2Fe-2S)-binding protein [Gynuella sp.]|uniref:(2Fe-2S)-binding protein n=1 Tax=Gynuella sp. TaxID=2969146 RepID=UPI003D1327AE